MKKEKEKFQLLVLIPNSGMSGEELKDRKEMLQAFASDSTEIWVECIPGGPKSIESEYEEAAAGRYILERIGKIPGERFQSVIIYCSSDPALSAAREISPVPVIGPGHASLMIAQDLGDQYSVLTVLEETVALFERKIRQFQFDPTRCRSVRSIGIPVSDLRVDLERTYQALLEAGKICVGKDRAHCIVLACLGMAGLGERLQKDLGVPVLDPAPVSIRYAELLHNAVSGYSRVSYPQLKRERGIENGKE